MKYLTRPAERPAKTLYEVGPLAPPDKELYEVGPLAPPDNLSVTTDLPEEDMEFQSVIEGFGEGLDRNERQEFDEGGVIGEDGMFEGEDLGTREGFAEIKTKGIIKTRELAELLRKTGLTVSDKNLSRLAEVYGIKRPNKVQVAYKDRNSTRIVDIKKPTQFDRDWETSFS